MFYNVNQLLLATMDTGTLVLTETINIHELNQPDIELAPTFLRMVYNVNLLLIATMDIDTLVLAEAIDVQEVDQSTQLI